MKGLVNKRLIIFICLVLSTVIISVCKGQNAIQEQKTIVGVNASDTLKTHSTRIVETAPLDIAQNRGLFIVTPEGKMQLRILGSVRYLVVFDGLNLSSKNAFSTYEIPTGTLNKALPNYYNGLDQTRLGFEVTRKTSKGDIFIRLETDFSGANGFRIRHSYGTYGKFLFGQTWSLFSHVSALPSMVDFAGPTASVITRTPQIRYAIPAFFKGINLAVGLEYLIPNLYIPDSIAAETFQLIPNITIRLDKVFSWGTVQMSGVIPMLSGNDSKGDFHLKVGWGLSGSVVVNSWENGKWYVQGVAGQAITRYFNDLSGNGLDILITPEGKIIAPVTLGFYGTYEHSWNTNLLSNFTYGWLQVEKFKITEDRAYHKGHSLRVNTFWDLAEGAKIGAEAIWGNRVDKNKQKGDALRLNLLFYYDF